MDNNVKELAKQFIDVVDQIEIQNKAAIETRNSIMNSITQLMEDNKENKEALAIAQNAIVILRQVSDDTVKEAYAFLEENLNTALAKMFRNSTRKIKIEESILRGQYPQLELRLEVENAKFRSLKSDSGHGIAQIVSLLCVLCLIVITGSRRILVMDEVISGVSVANREIISDIMWTFTEIGFQFIVNEHGFVPKGSCVHVLKVDGGVSKVVNQYIEHSGVYLQGESGKEYDYSQKQTDDDIDNNDIVNTTVDTQVISI